MTTRTRWAALATAALALITAACGASSSDGRACGPIVREALDPAYLVHVIGDRADVSYTSDPPTSGPHQAAPAIIGAATKTLPRPVQVGILERGDIVIQYSPSLPASEQRALEALASDHVVIAPNPDLPTTVVATAWTAKRSCGTVDVPSLQEFIAERGGKGPES